MTHSLTFSSPDTRDEPLASNIIAPRMVTQVGRVAGGWARTFVLGRPTTTNEDQL